MKNLFYFGFVGLFVLLLSLVLFKIFAAFRIMSQGRKGGDALITRRGRVSLMNAVVLLILLLALTVFLFEEFFGWEGW